MAMGRPTCFDLFADRFEGPGVAVELAVAEVEPHDVDAGVEQGTQVAGLADGRSQGGDDLGADGCAERSRWGSRWGPTCRRCYGRPAVPQDFADVPQTQEAADRGARRRDNARGCLLALVFEGAALLAAAAWGVSRLLALPALSRTTGFAFLVFTALAAGVCLLLVVTGNRRGRRDLIAAGAATAADWRCIIYHTAHRCPQNPNPSPERTIPMGYGQRDYAAPTWGGTGELPVSEAPAETRADFIKKTYTPPRRGGGCIGRHRADRSSAVLPASTLDEHRLDGMMGSQIGWSWLVVHRPRSSS